MVLDVHCSPVWEAAEKQKTEIRVSLTLQPETNFPLHSSHLVDGKSNGLHVLPLFTQLPAVLLDQANHKAASILSIIGVIVLLIQLDYKLRVRPECVCKETSST